MIWFASVNGNDGPLCSCDICVASTPEDTGNSEELYGTRNHFHEKKNERRYRGWTTALRHEEASRNAEGASGMGSTTGWSSGKALSALDSGERSVGMIRSMEVHPKAETEKKLKDLSELSGRRATGRPR